MKQYPWRRWFKSLFSGRTRSAARRSSHRSLHLEVLEARVTPAQVQWTGGGSDNNWTTAANWNTNAAPNPGDDLVFPTGALQLSNNDNIAAAKNVFNSVTFQGGGYTING